MIKHSDVKYADKQKAHNVQRRLQLLEAETLNELSKRNIKTETDLSQYQSTQILDSKKP